MCRRRLLAAESCVNEMLYNTKRTIGEVSLSRRRRDASKHEKTIADPATRANTVVVFVIDPTKTPLSFLAIAEQVLSCYLGCHTRGKSCRFLADEARKIINRAIPYDIEPLPHRGLNNAVQML